MKLFISHSQQDRPFILPMVEMLYSIGMSENDIFCSSIPELGIPGGKEIYEYLRELFVKEELYVLFMLSDRYYQSPNCLNEMGAAWIVKSKYTTFLLPGFTFAEMEGAVDPRKISIKLDDEEDIVRYRLGEFRDAISTCFSITTRLSEARWEKVRNDFLKDIEMQNTVVDMRKSDSFCIYDTSNAGCQIIYKDEYEVDGTIDFSKTFTKLSSIVFFMRFSDWRNHARKNKKLCFTFKTDNLYQKSFVELQLPKSGRNYKHNIVNGENQILLSEFGADLEDFQQVKELCFLFEKSEEKEETNFTIRNLRIE